MLASRSSIAASLTAIGWRGGAAVAGTATILYFFPFILYAVLALAFAVVLIGAVASKLRTPHTLPKHLKTAEQARLAQPFSDIYNRSAMSAPSSQQAAAAAAGGRSGNGVSQHGAADGRQRPMEDDSQLHEELIEEGVQSSMLSEVSRGLSNLGLTPSMAQRNAKRTKGVTGSTKSARKSRRYPDAEPPESALSQQHLVLPGAGSASMQQSSTRTLGESRMRSSSDLGEAMNGRAAPVGSRFPEQEDVTDSKNLFSIPFLDRRIAQALRGQPSTPQTGSSSSKGHRHHRHHLTSAASSPGGDTAARSAKSVRLAPRQPDVKRSGVPVTSTLSLSSRASTSISVADVNASVSRLSMGAVSDGRMGKSVPESLNGMSTVMEEHHQHQQNHSRSADDTSESSAPSGSGMLHSHSEVLPAARTLRTDRSQGVAVKQADLGTPSSVSEAQGQLQFNAELAQVLALRQRQVERALTGSQVLRLSQSAVAKSDDMDAALRSMEERDRRFSTTEVTDGVRPRASSGALAQPAALSGDPQLHLSYELLLTAIGQIGTPEQPSDPRVHALLFLIDEALQNAVIRGYQADVLRAMLGAGPIPAGSWSTTSSQPDQRYHPATTNGLLDAQNLRHQRGVSGTPSGISYSAAAAAGSDGDLADGAQVYAGLSPLAPPRSSSLQQPAAHAVGHGAPTSTPDRDRRSLQSHVASVAIRDSGPAGGLDHTSHSGTVNRASFIGELMERGAAERAAAVQRLKLSAEPALLVRLNSVLDAVSVTTHSRFLAAVGSSQRLSLPTSPRGNAPVSSATPAAIPSAIQTTRYQHQHQQPQHVPHNPGSARNAVAQSVDRGLAPFGDSTPTLSFHHLPRGNRVSTSSMPGLTVPGLIPPLSALQSSSPLTSVAALVSSGSPLEPHSSRSAFSRVSGQSSERKPSSSPHLQPVSAATLPVGSISPSSSAAALPMIKLSPAATQPVPAPVTVLPQQVPDPASSTALSSAPMLDPAAADGLLSKDALPSDEAKRASVRSELAPSPSSAQAALLAAPTLTLRVSPPSSSESPQSAQAPTLMPSMSVTPFHSSASPELVDHATAVEVKHSPLHTASTETQASPPRSSEVGRVAAGSSSSPEVLTAPSPSASPPIPAVQADQMGSDQTCALIHGLSGPVGASTALKLDHGPRASPRSNLRSPAVAAASSALRVESPRSAFLVVSPAVPASASAGDETDSPSAVLSESDNEHDLEISRAVEPESDEPSVSLGPLPEMSLHLSSVPAETASPSLGPSMSESIADYSAPPLWLTAAGMGAIATGPAGFSMAGDSAAADRTIGSAALSSRLSSGGDDDGAAQGSAATANRRASGSATDPAND